MTIDLPFVKYGSIDEITRVRELKELLECDLNVFEKIDGGLCQIRNHQGRIIPGCKANYLTGATVDKNEWFGKFIGWMYSNPTLYNLPNDIVVFGEWSGNHTIDYGKNNDRFFLIDVLDLNSRRFFGYESAQKLLKEYEISGLSTLPILASGRIEKGTIDDLLKKPSDYYAGPKEGLVVKSYETSPQKFVKILNEGFAELRSGLFGGLDPFTEARVRKNILHALEEFDYEEITVEDLYGHIREDVRKETGKTYDLNYVKKKTEPYVLEILQREGKRFPLSSSSSSSSF